MPFTREERLAKVFMAHLNRFMEAVSKTLAEDPDLNPHKYDVLLVQRDALIENFDRLEDASDALDPSSGTWVEFANLALEYRDMLARVNYHIKILSPPTNSRNCSYTSSVSAAGVSSGRAPEFLVPILPRTESGWIMTGYTPSRLEPGTYNNSDSSDTISVSAASVSSSRAPGFIAPILPKTESGWVMTGYAPSRPKQSTCNDSNSFVSAVTNSDSFDSASVSNSSDAISVSAVTNSDSSDATGVSNNSDATSNISSHETGVSAVSTSSSSIPQPRVPTVQETRMTGVVAGNTAPSHFQNSCGNTQLKAEFHLAPKDLKQCEPEQVVHVTSAPSDSERAENHSVSTLIRVVSDRCVMRLPFTKNPRVLGKLKSHVVKRSSPLASGLVEGLGIKKLSHSVRNVFVSWRHVSTTSCISSQIHIVSICTFVPQDCATYRGLFGALLFATVGVT